MDLMTITRYDDDELLNAFIHYSHLNDVFDGYYEDEVKMIRKEIIRRMK